jgi:hypothetical protein
LNYDRVNRPLSRREWNQTAANALAEDPILFAGGGQNKDFHVVYSRLPQERLLLGQERPVVTQLLKDYPYALFIFSNQSQDYWHFINVKYDTETEKRRLFRRITISPEERLRTAAERLSLIDLESIGLSPLAIQQKHDEAFDVEAVTEKFFKAYKAVFEYVEGCISGITSVEAKRLYTQRLFNRLMFIAFIQKKGWLKFEGKTDYLSSLWSDYLKKKQDGDNLYRDRLKLLFFAGLNTSSNVNIVDINRKGVLSQLIGDVPFLNGGLFEEEKDDTDPSITVPDRCFDQILERLFGSFNFTVMESTPLDVEVAVDPEMLGKIFERLVNERQRTGSYYTPKTIVSFMCREALKAYLVDRDTLIDKHDVTGISIPEARSILEKLSNIRVCDPACGSGAYLVGMLHELHELMRLLDTKSAQTTARGNYQLKLDIIQNNLYGVDLDAFAVNIARLRLWLTLAVEYEGDKPEPLPNLDFKIEVGDSLTAPDPHQGSQQAIVGELAKQLKVKTTIHMRTHHYGEKATLKKEAEELQKQIAGWVHAGATISGFDWAVQFPDVFLNGGFDVILANPPYGITCEDPLRFQYFPKIKGEDTQSKDSYGLFIARGLQLIRTGGVLTYIVSDTWRTIRSHRPLRKKLLNETQVMHLLDLPPWVFDATVNTCILSTIKQAPAESHELIAGDLRNLPRGDWSTLEQNLIAISAHGPDCSTTTYARYTYLQSLTATYNNLSFFIGSPRLYSLMSDNRFVKLGDIADVKVGLQTSDNDYYLRKRPGAHGSYQILNDAELLMEQEITGLSEEEKHSGVNPAKYGGRHFVLYDKGGESDAEEGWLPNYYVPTQYFIDWSKAAVNRLHTFTIADVKRRKGEELTIKPADEHTRAAVIRNQDYYFQRGITFSPTGIYSPSFRLGCAAVFGNKGSTIFLKAGDPLLYLGLLCSLVSRYLLKTYRSHTVETGEEVIAQLGIPPISDDMSSKIRNLVESVIKNQTLDLDYAYFSREQEMIDNIIYEHYGLNEQDVREVELWYCRRYPKLAEAQGALAEVKQKYGEHLKRCELVMSKGPDYWKSNPVLELIAQGEGEKLELKETLEVDAKTGDRNAGVLMAALKTMAAFLNTEGGTMLIGVADSGEIRGLSKDYKLCHKHDKDGFEQKIYSLIMSRFVPQPTGKIKISFEQLEDKQVCVISVEKSKDIVHLDGKDVYVREGNTSRKLEGPSLTAWVKNRS